MAVLFREIGNFDPEALMAETFWSTFEGLCKRAIVSKNTWLMPFGGMFYRLRGDPRNGSATGRTFPAARNWVEIIIKRAQVLGEVRTDLPQSLLIDSMMPLLEWLDRWVVSHWNELAADEKESMPQMHIALFHRLLPAKVARAAPWNDVG